MRTNLPVTNAEVALNEHFSIVSITDLKGEIIYANPYFIEISGYAAEELIGRPHNMLRHPDMPAEAFRDMWETIRAGHAWNGMVKNRCKDGGYYWVMANVTPVIENGNPVGYMSVRVKPTREQVAAAKDLYAELQAGNPRQVAFSAGNVVKGGWLGKLIKLTQLSLKQRVRYGCAATAIGALVLSVATYYSSELNSTTSLLFNLVCAGTVLITLWLWYFLENSIIIPMQEALLATQKMAGGDLTGITHANPQGDMGHLLQSLRQLNVNLHGVIGDVRQNFQSMLIATREIAEGNMDLSRRTESQAASLEETAASMEQLAATVENNAQFSAEASKMMTKAYSVAQSGGEIVNKVISTIGDINQSSQKIVDIIGIIDGIAFQTNILALNAAVEAARAGEQGRGFAVVASEVRSLAQRSASAAKEIKDLIGTSVEKVDSGTVLANSAGATMSEIILSVNQGAGIVHEISQASHEQSDGINQVNQAVTLMDDVTQQNAALVEQAAAATAGLAQQASTLMEALSVFKLNGPAAREITHV